LWAARPKGMRALVRKESELALLGLWLLCPLPLPCALSKLLGSMDLIRCIISAAPALCILLAVAAVTVRDVTPELVILGLVVVLTAALLRQYYVDIVNEKWHEAAPYIERKASPGDAVVVTDSSLGRRAFAWYYDGRIKECDTKSQERHDVAMLGTEKGYAGHSERLLARTWVRSRYRMDYWAKLSDKTGTSHCFIS